MRFVILGAFGQYKLQENGEFFKKKFTHSELGDVVKEEWEEVKTSFGVTDYTGAGYYTVSAATGKNSSHRLHRLVAKYFVPGYEKGLSVNHIDGDRSNNSAENLEWVTRRANIRNAVERGVFEGRGAFSGKINDMSALTMATLINAGWTNKKIAEHYGFDASNVSRFKNKKQIFKQFHYLVD
jgi:hypothetical protein